MPLHLQKLCVGCDSVQELADWLAEKLAEQRRRGLAEEQIHTTRMMPKRLGDLVDGGSLYWVIKGTILVRQRLLALRPVTGDDGIGRCQIVLEPMLHEVEPLARRAFQGWRYLDPEDAPRDLAAAMDATGLPAHITLQLRELGLL